jgi:hypothetical protein
MTSARRHIALAAVLALLLAAAPAGAVMPAWLPRYDLDIDLDVAGHQARVRLLATWTNPHAAPTSELVFNAHSRYVVPAGQVGFMAKMLELLRMKPGDALGEKEPPLDIHTVTLVHTPGTKPLPAGAGPELKFRYEGDTKTALVVPLPFPVGPGESVSVLLDMTFRLPPKQGRWGQWEGVTYLSNWLPVFAYYGDPPPKKNGPGPACFSQKKEGGCAAVCGAPPDEEDAGLPPPRPLLPGLEAPPRPRPAVATWQPTEFIPWHQPFFNEAGHYHARVRLPCDQKVACTGTVLAARDLGDGRKELDVEALGMRDFAFLCSGRYRLYEGEVPAGPGVAPVRIHVAAFPEHEFYAREMLTILRDALTAYSHWFGPYPYHDFTIAEAFFGWNGNECGGLVMIDERVFAMPHLAHGYVDSLVSHEACHQWWYNQVGTNGYCETWMDEGLATYFSHRLMDRKHGRNNKLLAYPRGLEWLPNIRRDDYRSYGMYGTFRRGENGPCVQEMQGFGHIVNLFSLTYDKGSRVVGMIEDRLGEAAFLDFMHLVFTRYQYRILRVKDFQRELEAYTGYSWEGFFADWVYGKGLSDWALEKVEVRPPPRCVKAGAGPTHVTVVVEQRAEYNEQTVLGFALPDADGYPIRVPIIPQAGSYHVDNPPARVTALAPNRVCVEVVLPEEPCQVAVDPDQVLIDKDPSNNFWKMPVRWRLTPAYTFLEETDLTNSYDRWNFIFGPWLYTTAYYDAWYTRSTMVGVRAGAYRTQVFSGGAYVGYRTDFRDVVAGFDGMWDHWPDTHWQTGINGEHRLAQTVNGDSDASRAVAWARYVFQYGSSLYLPPMQYLEGFAAYQDNFFPFERNPALNGQRFDRTSTLGLHYRINYLTPYWDPEGGFQFDVYYEGGLADVPEHVGLQKLSGQFAMVKYLPDLSGPFDGVPGARPALKWLADTRLALRAYGATSVPTSGEFFTMGGSQLFRAFDLAERQGSTVWVGSVEWRLPVATGLHWDCCDHVLGLRNVYVAPFYDVGDAYISNRSVGPVAHGVGTGLRLDVAWFGFVERTTLRIDAAKALNSNNATQIWFGVQHPF